MTKIRKKDSMFALTLCRPQHPLHPPGLWSLDDSPSATYTASSSALLRPPPPPGHCHQSLQDKSDYILYNFSRCGFNYSKHSSVRL